MSLPLTRNTNYVPGATPIKGADLNDIQDKIVSIVTVEKSVIIHAFESPLFVGTFVDSTTPQGYWRAGGAESHRVYLPLRKGDRLKQIEFLFMKKAGAGNKTFAVVKRSFDSAAPNEGSIGGTWSATGGTGVADADDEFLLNGTDYELGVDDKLVAVFTAAVNLERLYAVRVTWDRQVL